MRSVFLRSQVGHTMKLLADRRRRFRSGLQTIIEAQRKRVGSDCTLIAVEEHSGIDLPLLHELRFWGSGSVLTGEEAWGISFLWFSLGHRETGLLRTREGLIWTLRTGFQKIRTAVVAGLVAFPSPGHRCHFRRHDVYAMTWPERKKTPAQDRGHRLAGSRFLVTKTKNRRRRRPRLFAQARLVQDPS